MTKIKRGKTSQVSKVSTVDSIRNAVARLDSLFEKKAPRYYKVYVKTSSTADYFAVEDLNNLPENVVETINLYLDRSGKPIILRDIPTSESGDFFNVYSHYFDKNGRTIAFNFASSFSGDNCQLSNETIREEFTNIYSPEFKTIKRDHSLTNDSGKKIDSSKCVFNYRFNYKVYRSYQSISWLSGLIK